MKVKSKCLFVCMFLTAFLGCVFFSGCTGNKTSEVTEILNQLEPAVENFRIEMASIIEERNNLNVLDAVSISIFVKDTKDLRIEAKKILKLSRKISKIPVENWTEEEKQRFSAICNSARSE